LSFLTTFSSKAARQRPSVASYSNKPTFTRCSDCRPASSTRKASKPTSSSSTANQLPRNLGPISSGFTTYESNKHFTLKEPSSSEIDWRSVSPKGQRCSADQNPLKRADLDDFVASYNPKNRHERKESERFKSFTYEELIKRDKLNLDIFWLKDESLEDSANLPDPDVIAQEIVEDLEAALSQFATIATDAGNSYKGTNDAELPQARKDQPQKPS
jgi:hypothetical protein